MAGADTGRVSVEEAHDHGVLLFQATREGNHGDIAEGRQFPFPPFVNFPESLAPAEPHSVGGITTKPMQDANCLFTEAVEEMPIILGPKKIAKRGVLQLRRYELLMELLFGLLVASKTLVGAPYHKWMEGISSFGTSTDDEKTPSKNALW